MKGKLDELLFEKVKQSIREYISKAKALVMKLDQNKVSTTRKGN